MKVKIASILLILLLGCCPKPATPPTASSTVPTQTTAEKPAYRAAELGLIPGTVVDFAPSDEIVDAAIARGSTVDIWIHIQQSDGTIGILKCSYENWVNLHPDDILK